ncbi:MAG: DUF3597 domain-containing protein [Treponema sp.]|nr:DUF3597 domain-containing protein [Treponema sp.]
MSIFNSIKDKILGKPTPAPAAPAKPAAAPVMSGTAAAAIAAGKAAAAAQPVQAPRPAAQPVDVAAVLDAAAKAKGIKLNWRESIVDLLRTIDLDSSLAARKELAAELKYSGTHPDGSAEKNIWLHKEVMKALAANGGKVPSGMGK